MTSSLIKYKLIYILWLPLAGLLAGLILFAGLNFINGPLSRTALYLSVGIWGGYGAVAGVFGLVRLRKLSKIIEDSKRKGG